MKRREAIILFITVTSAVAGYQLLKKPEKSLEPDFNFLEDNKDLIASIVDIIIPENEYVGAKQAGVHNYVLNLVKFSLPLKEANVIINGLIDIRNKALNNYGKIFESCSEKEKQIVIRSVLDGFHLNQGIIGKVKNRLWGLSFFDIMKQITVEGYCTSKEGATTALLYLPIPGLYKGCIKIDSSHKVWAI